MGTALLWGQGAATIVGFVADPSGAAVVGAKVAVSDVAKGFIRVMSSDSAGAYTAAKIPIGRYTVTVEAPGFQKVVNTGIELTVGQTLRVDVQMQLGSAAAEINVSGNVTKVETESGTISDVVTGSQVTQLNLNGRNFTNLATLVPGAAPGGYDPSNVGVLASSAISFNGAPGQYNNWEIDGVPNTDQGAGGSANMVYPSIDAIAEFRIYTSIYDASIGKNAGATIELATKSGTNQFHGTMFEFIRNDAFDANDWFANRQVGLTGPAPKTPLKRNDFGFTIGGPVFVPKVYNTDKSKTFFFWSEEWRRNRDGTLINTTVPTLKMRQGDFSECDPLSANYNVVAASNCAIPTDPAAMTSYPNDIVPIQPQASALLNALIPLPNNGVNGYTSALSLPTNFRDDIVRLDQNIGSKNSVFLRYIQDSYEKTFTPTLWSSADYDTVNTLWTSPARSAVVHLTTTIKPNLLNEFMMTYSDDVNTVTQTAGASSPAGSVTKPANWSAPTLAPGNAGVAILPGVSICGGTPFCAHQSTGFDFLYLGPVFTWKDNVVWSRGGHNLKFGFSLIRTRLDQTEDSGPIQGMYTFSNSNPNTTGNALADMYVGQIAEYTENTGVSNGAYTGGYYPGGRWVQWDFEPYFQDDWHVTKNLTLNLGLRYYLPQQFADTSKLHLDSTFIPSAYRPGAQAQLDSSGNLIQGSGQTYLSYGNGLVECGAGGIPRGCQEAFRTGWAPRVGFSWDPTGSGKTVVRGGYGISYDIANGNEGAASFFGNPPNVANPTVYNVVGYQNVAGGVIAPTSMSIIPRRAKFPSVQQFSLGIQHQFSGSNVLSVSYVGSAGRHLLQNRNQNQVYPGETTQDVPALAGTPGCTSSGTCDVQYVLINNLQPSTYFNPYRGYSDITLRDWAGNSNYNSLQVNFRHTVGHGLTLQAAYTWSHNIDDVGGSGVNDYDMSRWRATSNLNQAQMLVLNYTYEIPFFTHARNVFLRSAVGGWQLSGVTSFLTGQPLDFTCGISGTGSGVGGSVRCNALGALTVEKGSTNDPTYGPTPTWFDPASIGQINYSQLAANGEPGMFGNLGRNVLTGPGRNNWDLAVLKNFAMPWFKSEKSNIQFRAESFNSFNHPQWNSINIGCGSETPAGAPCSGNENNLGNGEVNGAWPARVLQLGLKFVF